MTALKDQLKLEIESTNPPNPIQNPTGALGVSSWSSQVTGGSASGTLASDATSTPVAQDTYSLKATSTTTGTPFFYSNTFPVAPGQYVGAQVSFYPHDANTVGRVITRYLDSDGNILTGGGVATNAVASGSIGVATTLTPNAAPGGTVAAQIMVAWNTWTGAAGKVAYFGKAVAKVAATQAGAVPAYTPPTYTDVVGASTTIRWSQGNELDGVEDKITPGLFTAIVKDATIDPAANSAMYRGRLVRLSALNGATWEEQFVGTINTLNTSYNTDTSKTLVTITATDAGTPLTQTQMDVCGTDSLETVLGWDVRKATGVATDDGAGNLPQASNLQSYAEGSYAADWLRRACNTFGGYAWVDKRNRVQARSQANLPTASTTFSDNKADTGATFYTGIDPAFSSEALVNALTVTRINIDEEDGRKAYGPYRAPASIAKWGIVPAEVEILAGTPSAIAAPLLQTFATPTVYPRSVTFNATYDISKATSLTLYQKIVLKRAALINATYRLIKISHEIKATNTGGKWITTIELRPLETGQPAVTVVSPGLGDNTGPADTVPFTAAPQKGLVSVPASATAVTSLTVNFPIPYQTAPTVVHVTLNVIVPTDRHISVSNITATGFTIYLKSISTTSVPVMWSSEL